VIQPGFGFGTGYHESTHLALQLLEQVAEFHPFQSVLDVGTGSGILSIGALLLGAREVYAIDIDSDAINEVKSNLELSGLDAINCSVEVGDVAGLIRAPSDLVMANIEDHILIGLADDLLRLTKPGGVLLLSGILTERKLELLSKLGSRIEQVSQLELNEWTGLTLKKPERLAVTNQ
jgi:ribosomal protein L11 methyltransferase